MGRNEVAGLLSAAGARVTLHHEHFAPGMPDTEWLPRVGREGWVLLTKDQGIRQKPAEREILLAAGVRSFILSAGNLAGAAMGNAFVTALKRMVRMVHSEPGAFVATVDARGKVAFIQRGCRRRARASGRSPS